MVCSPVFYPAKFEQEGQAYNVSFRDIPEAITCGDNFEDAYRWPKMRCSPVWTFIVKRVGLYLHPVNAKRVRS
jgi:hypothetical protein